MKAANENNVENGINISNQLASGESAKKSAAASES